MPATWSLPRTSAGRSISDRAMANRQIAALLKRERRSAGEEPVDAKRIYRLMKMHGLLLQRRTGRHRPHKHDGKVVTLRSNVR